MRQVHQGKSAQWQKVKVQGGKKKRDFPGGQFCKWVPSEKNGLVLERIHSFVREAFMPHVAKLTLKVHLLSACLSPVLTLRLERASEQRDQQQKH